MKIVHLCLCGPVTDGWTYQDNLLPKFHRALGHKVTTITSQQTWNERGELTLTARTGYQNECDVRVIRLPLRWGGALAQRLRAYTGVYEHLEDETPDLLFIHGCQFLDLVVVIRYLKRHPNIRVFVDNHADFSNSATNWLSRHVLHGGLWKQLAQMVAPYTTRFFGVLPARVDFLTHVYGLPSQKCELLVMGADDDKVARAANPQCTGDIRARYGIAPTDFLVVTGGKIDAAKAQTLLLMQAIAAIARADIKLLVFGSVSPELHQKLHDLCCPPQVQYIGWLQADDTYAHFAAANLVVFPGRHSVFWEQVAGQGIPMLCKYWAGTTHVDLGGNVRFLYRDSVEEIASRIEELVSRPQDYANMLATARTEGMKRFSYRQIAQRTLTDLP